MNKHPTLILFVLFFSFTLLLALGATVLAGSLEDAMEAYNRGDYEITFNLLKPLAEQVDECAQNNLG